MVRFPFISVYTIEINCYDMFLVKTRNTYQSCVQQCVCCQIYSLRTTPWINLYWNTHQFHCKRWWVAMNHKVVGHIWYLCAQLYHCWYSWVSLDLFYVQSCTTFEWNVTHRLRGLVLTKMFIVFIQLLSCADKIQPPHCTHTTFGETMGPQVTMVTQLIVKWHWRIL